MTQQDLADMMELQVQSIKQMLNKTSLRTDTLKRIADALGVPLWQLFISREEVIGEESNAATTRCPYCGKSIRISLTVEQDDFHGLSPKPHTHEALRLNVDDGTQYRYKRPRTEAERMAILELQTLPGEDGMCSVRNVCQIDSDGSEVYDVEFDRLTPMD